jgi:hypothetical protein
MGVDGDGSNVDIYTSGAFFVVNGNALSKTTPTAEATAGNVTYTAAQMLLGMILRDPNGGARSDVTPTAALLVAAIKRRKVGSTFSLIIRNTADAAETITMTAGTGVTLSGTMTIAQNNSKLFLVRLDNITSGAEAATMYSVGTFVH